VPWRPSTASPPPRACTPASTRTGAARARCSSRSSGRRAHGTATGLDGDHDGRTSAYDPADAIPAAARYLKASGAPQDYRAALFAYNHAEWYVAEVLAKAAQYRGNRRTTDGEPQLDSAALREVLDSDGITLTPIQRDDLRSGTIDPRLAATLAWIGRHHAVVITALKSGHSR
jgi:hypothetical protein